MNRIFNTTRPDNVNLEYDGNSKKTPKKNKKQNSKIIKLQKMMIRNLIQMAHFKVGLVGFVHFPAMNSTLRFRKNLLKTNLI